MAEALMELYETISPEAQRELFDFALFLASRQVSRTKDSAVLKSRIEDLQFASNSPFLSKILIDKRRLLMMKKIVFLVAVGVLVSVAQTYIYNVNGKHYGKNRS